MPPASNLLAFGLAAFALIVVPGPSVLFVIGRSLALGRSGGLLSVVGNAAGMLPQIAAVALGVGVVVAQSAVLFTVIKLAGAVYLVYLGVQAVRHRKAPPPAGARRARTPALRILGEGFLVGLSNPKSIVFFVAVLPQFVDYRGGGIPLQLAVLGLVFVAIALVSDSVWALAAGSARSWFARSPGRITGMRTAGGLMMIGLGGTLAVTGGKS